MKKSIDITLLWVYNQDMKQERMGETNKFNITVTVNKHELKAIDDFLKPFCGSRGPFIKKIVLDKIGYTAQQEAEND